MSPVNPKEDPPVEKTVEKPNENTLEEAAPSSENNIQMSDKKSPKPTEINALCGGDSGLLDKDKISEQSLQNTNEILDPDSDVTSSTNEKSFLPQTGKDDLLDVQDDDMELKWDDDEDIDEEKLLADDTSTVDDKIQQFKETSAIIENEEQVSEGDEINTISKERDDMTNFSKTNEITQKDTVLVSPATSKNKIDDDDDLGISKNTTVEDHVNIIENLKPGTTQTVAAIVEKEDKLEVEKCELMDIDEFEKDFDDLKGTANSTLIKNIDKSDDVKATSGLEEMPLKIKDHNLKQPDVMIDIPTQELIDLPDDSGTSDSKNSTDISLDEMEAETTDPFTENIENIERKANDDLNKIEEILESIPNENVLVKEFSKDFDGNETESTTNATSNQEINKEEKITVKPTDTNVTTDMIEVLDSKIIIKDSPSNKQIEEEKITNNVNTNKLDVSQTKEQLSAKTEVLQKQMEIADSSKAKQNEDIIKKIESVIDDAVSTEVTIDTEIKTISNAERTINIEETQNETTPEIISSTSTSNTDKMDNMDSKEMKLKTEQDMQLNAVETVQDVKENVMQTQFTESEEHTIDSRNTKVGASQVKTDVNVEQTELGDSENITLSINEAFTSTEPQSKTAKDILGIEGIHSTDDQPDTSDEVPEMTDSLGLLAESMWKDDEQESSGNDEGDDDEEFDDDADESNQMTSDNCEDSNAQTSETDAPDKPTDAQAFSDIAKMMGDQIGDDGGDKDVTLDDDTVCDEIECEIAEKTLEPDIVKEDEYKELDTEKSKDTDFESTDSQILKKLLTSSANETPRKRNLSLSTASSRHVVNMVWLEGSSSDEDQKSCKDPDKPSIQPEATSSGDMTSINIPSEIEVMSSGENTSDIVTKDGEVVISGLPKRPPTKPARLNTGEVTIKTTNSADANKSPAKSSTEVVTEPKLNPEVFSLDSDEEETTPAKAHPSPPEHKNNKCINTNCASDSSAQFYIASPSTIAYYDFNKMDKNKRAMVCEACLQVAHIRAESLVEGIRNFTPLLDLDMGSLCQELVEISDSDSESEVDITEVDDDVIGTDEAEFLKEQLADILNETWTKYDLDSRLQIVEDDLSEQMAKLEKDSAELDDMLNKCQQDTDRIRKELYETFEPERRELSPILIYDTPTNLYTCAESKFIEERAGKRRLSDSSDVPTKRTTYAPLTYERKETKPRHDSKEDDDKDVSVVHLSAERAPAWLPPAGAPVRAPLVPGLPVYVRRAAAGSWLPAAVLDVLDHWEKGADNTRYTMVKVKVEIKGKQCVRTVQSRFLAYNEPCEVRLTIGTRVIALFKGSALKNDSFYSGVIAEVPNPVNSYRYLVFFDDGYAQYVQHSDTRLVVECSPQVWEEVQTFSREFVKQYLLAYPERPMVRLHPDQKLKCEWNGQWLTCKVTKVDASLAEIVFESDNRTEWIYRGSTRLLPLYRELQAAERTKGRFMTRNRQITTGVNMPYVEYTRSDDKPSEPQPSTSAQQEELRRQQRAVAKKSTGAAHQVTAPVAPPVADSSTSRVVYYTPKNAVRPHKMVPHTCGPKCKRTDVLALKDLRTYNPLAKPLLSGWERQVVKYKGHKQVMYRAPCGRRVRGPAELHAYLRRCGAGLPLDLFDFAAATHCLAEFVLNKCNIAKKDLSNGKENVPVPCVNYYDNSLPDFCSYNTERTPTEGVPLNLDPEFLCGCDCTDDCQDKSKCACWQMTLEGARTIGLEGQVGYEYKRLLEPLPTGIYECNSRCKCKNTCLNRVAQHPLQLKLQVFKTSNRGWGIRALNDIPRGAFICVYAGNLLTDATANLDGLNEGDEYLAELDYIEVVEQIKEGYENDIPDADKLLDKKEGNQEDDYSSEMSSSEEEPSKSNDENDGDFQPGYLSATPLEFNKRLRKRDRAKKKESKNAEKKEAEKKHKEGDNDDCITISDDDEVREPSRFTAQAGMGKSEFTSKYKSVRAHFGKDEKCYIMDAKVQGNIGRYLNHSCTPNVFVQNVFVDTHDPRFPWVGFFALCAVKAGSELTWNYNYDVGSVPGKVLYCYCGAPNCRGRLL